MDSRPARTCTVDSDILSLVVDGLAVSDTVFLIDTFRQQKTPT